MEKNVLSFKMKKKYIEAFRGVYFLENRRENVFNKSIVFEVALVLESKVLFYWHVSTI